LRSPGAFAGGDAAVKLRIPLIACQRRPVAVSSVAGGAMVFVPAARGSAIYSPFLASHTSLDPVHLASELKTRIPKKRADNLERTGSRGFRPRRSN